MAAEVLRVGDSGDQAGRVGVIDLVRVNTGHFVTPVSTSTGRLKLISWNQDADGGFTRLGDSGNQAGEIKRVKSVAVGNNRVVTAVETKGSGRLKLISWQVSADGTAINRVDDSGSLAGKVDRIDLHRWHADDNDQPPIDLVTTVRSTTTKRLKLIGWRLFNTGGFTRTGDSGNQAGQITRLAGQPGIGQSADLSPAGHDFNYFSTAVRASGSKRLKVIGWRIEQAGGGVTFDRLGDSGTAAGDVKGLDLAAGNLSVFNSTNTFFTSVRTTGDRLKVIAWTTNEGDGTVVRSGDSGNQAGDVRALWGEYKPFVEFVSAVRVAANDRLRVIWWGPVANREHEGSDATIERRADSGNQAGPIVAVTGLITDNDNNGTNVVTAVKTKDAARRLKLINWHLG